MDRFRTLPIWQAAPLVGPLIADVVRYAVTALMVLGVGILLGFDAQGGPAGLLAGASLVVGFAFALSWVFTTLGLVMRSPSAVQGISMTASFVVVFVSNVFVDPETLPSILEVVVRVNPISHLVTAVRGLLAGDTSIGDIALVVGEGSVLTAVFATLTARLYARI